MMVLSFGKKFPQALSRIQRCNVLVIGNTGVGKSTLISTLFNKPISNSITQKISDRPYIKLGLSIGAYDSPGLERDKKQRDKVKQNIAKFIKQQNQKEPSEQIHAVWYCVNSQVTRASEIDDRWISLITKDLPVLAIVTRAYGVEKDWLQPYLEEEVPGVQRVVPILTKTENIRAQRMEPYGLDNLLSATEDLLEEIAQKAITNAVEAKADQAFAWYRDGCATVLATQIAPVPFMKFAAFPLQTLMLGGISKTFGYNFSQKYLSELCKIGTVASGFEGLDLLIENKIRNLPGVDYNNIQTVKDVLSHLTSSIDHVTGVIPFKEQLIGLLTDISNSHWVSALPILNCMSAIATSLATGFLAIAYIEAMKKYKQAEYEGQPMPELKNVLTEQIKQLMDIVQQLTGTSWISGLVG